LVERNLAKVEVESSRLFSRSRNRQRQRWKYEDVSAIIDGCSACNAGVAQLVERNLAKVEVESSRLFSRSSFDWCAVVEVAVKVVVNLVVVCGNSNAGVAQLVERNLAKVEVESSRLFSRSRFCR
jgi:hypothetical protein